MIGKISHVFTQLLKELSISKSHDACVWLLSCSNIRTAVPIVATIGKFNYPGSLYGTAFRYQEGERAVKEGLVKAGEERVEYRLYLLGHRPVERRRTCYKWHSGLPVDSRAESVSNEWFLAGYIGDTAITPQFQPYHPLGANFILNEWLIPTYGPFMGLGIDMSEDSPYQRREMSIRFLETE